MLEKLIGREVEVTVAFSIGAGDGAVPVIYTGTLLDIDNEFIKVDVTSGIMYYGSSASKAMASGMMKSFFGADETSLETGTSGKLIINRKYIISVLEG
jgi:hypothetical protein